MMTEESDFVRAWKSLRLQNLAPGYLVQIPCFRDAGLAGFACLFVFGSVTFVFHGKVRRAANYAVGGFLLGAIFGWETCNSRRRQQQDVISKAKERFANRDQN